jgi:hypothetical protein
MESISLRPFDWRDLAQLHRVKDRGLCLDSQLASTRGANAMQHALLDVFNPNRTTLTLVAKSKTSNGETLIGQCIHKTGENNARLTFMGPEAQLEGEAGLRLIDGLTRAAGELGAHSVSGDVDESSSTVLQFKRAGFSIYTRQRIWKLAPDSHRNHSAVDNAWRPEQEADFNAVRGLYLNLVPALIQQFELPPYPSNQNWVHWRNGELMGYLDIERGPLGIWAQPYLHPDAEEVDLLLEAVLDRLLVEGKPIYFCVRSYQGWVSQTLKHLQFEAHVDLAVMVKRIAVGVQQAKTSELPALEGTYPNVTAPFAKVEDRSTSAQSGGGL